MNFVQWKSCNRGEALAKWANQGGTQEQRGRQKTIGVDRLLLGTKRPLQIILSVYSYVGPL